MKEIQLTQNKVALVDDCDFDFINQFKWYANKLGAKSWYAIRGSDKVPMHKLILPGGMVDHRDRDGLNNQRGNLRYATKAQNAANSVITGNFSSKYRGVYKLKTCKRWEAYIHLDNKKKSLGLFKTEIEAALAYNNAAKEYFGEFANPNVV